jgi:hypothetical protein
MPFLDDLIGVHDVSANGDPPVPRRALLNFVGSAVQIVDNPILGSTDITVSDIGGNTITPPIISVAQINDYAPSGVSAAAVIRVACSPLQCALTGLSYVANQYPRPALMNVGAVTLFLQHQAAASAASHRIITPNGATVSLLPGGTVELVRDVVDNRWRVVLL